MDLNENTIYNPYSNITSVSSLRPKKADITERILQFTEEDAEAVSVELNQIERMNNANSLVDMNDLTIAHIAGTIEARIKHAKNICDLCQAVFRENERVYKSYTGPNTHIPCQSTFKICRVADYYLKLEILKGQFSSDQIHFAIFSSLHIENLYMQSFENHHETDHKNKLIQIIICDYIRIKGNHIAKTITFSEQEKTMRQRLNRMTIFHNS